VRFNRSVKTENVQRWAGLWMRVDKGKDSMAFDNMHNRPIKGTTAWQNYEGVLDVPPDATAISLGILLEGTGAVWLDRVSVEVVGPEGPVNLGFEKP
jgi:hypothetical protein